MPVFVSRGSLVAKSPTLTSQSLWVDGARSPSLHAWRAGSYAEVYRRHLWVYVVVNKLANGLARLPLPVYLHDDMNRPRADDHPMARLLAAPNPAWSPFDMWFWVSATRDIYGTAFLFKGRTDGVVTGLWPLHPAYMTWQEASGTWRFDNGRLVLADVRPADLVTFRHFNPDSMIDGLSPLEPLRSTLENEWSARSATSSFWRQGARPGVVLRHPSRISDPAMTRLKAQWESVTSGAAKQGATVILEEGMTLERHMLTAEEAQYIETRKLNREEVCGAYDVPPPAVHILDRATFSNITEQMRSIYRDTQAPRASAFQATIELDLRRAEWPDDPVYAEFLMDDVLRGDFETRQAALAQATYMTIAEKRKVENLPFIEGTDRIFLNTATLPLDAIDAQADAIRADLADPDPADPPAGDGSSGGEGASVVDVRTVMGRLSWQKDLSEVDAVALVAGLAPGVGAKVQAAVLVAADLGDLRARLRGMA